MSKTPDFVGRTVSFTQRFAFEAAHHLPTHRGKCARIHGHNYKLEVTVEGVINEDPTSPEYGMVVDFDYVKDVVDERIINVLDHRLLNESEMFGGLPPTTENVAWVIYGELRRFIPGLLYIRVWETDRSTVDVYEEDYAEWFNQPKSKFIDASQ